MIKRTLLPSLILGAIGLLCCRCDGYESSIPDANVYLRRNITVEKLTPLGSYLYVPERVLATDRVGFGGLLVVHGQDNNFYAVDLACPHEVNATVKVGPPDSKGLCHCAVCGEDYDMSFGMGLPQKHISKEALRHYNVYLEENDYLEVRR